MKRWIGILGVLFSFSAFLAGCGSFNLTTKPRSQPPPAVTRTDDSRPIEDIRAENDRLRARQADLENSHREWQAAVDREERTKKDMKSQKDRAENDLKQAKKRAKKS